MESISPTSRRALVAHPQPSTTVPDARALGVDTQRVLRNTYALLALTLLFSAGVAAAAVAWALPAPGVIVTLAGYFGLLFAVYKLRNRAAGVLRKNCVRLGSTICRLGIERCGTMNAWPPSPGSHFV